MLLSNTIVDVTIYRGSFVFSQSRAKVPAGFTNGISLAVASFDLVYCSLSIVVVKLLSVCVQHDIVRM